MNTLRPGDIVTYVEPGVWDIEERIGCIEHIETVAKTELYERRVIILYVIKNGLPDYVVFGNLYQSELDLTNVTEKVMLLIKHSEIIKGDPSEI